MAKQSLVWAIVVTGIFIGQVATAESMSDKLESGIYQEETAGQIDDAIEIYQQIVNETEANRPYAAQALYRLGQCHLKKGNQRDASAHFEKLIVQYPDQPSLVDEAREQLQKLRTSPVHAATPGKKIALSHVDNSAEGKKSLGGSGHAVRFERPTEAQQVTGIEIFASRYGYPKPPKEDFHVYLLDGDQKIVADFKYPYAKIARSGMRWYKLPTKPTAVPETFYVALSFNPQRTKGVYLGYDEDVDESHSYIGLPGQGFEPVPEKYDWMVRVKFAAAATAGDGDKHRDLLDAKTLAAVQKYDRMFASWFRREQQYDLASEAEKEAMVEQWMLDAASDNFKKRTRAIGAMGNVAAPQAVDVLLQIVEEPMSNNRPKWMAVRALGEIGDPAAVPALIERVDHGNHNTRVYARASLAQITGVYFGADKAKWRDWLAQQGKQASDSDKKFAETFAARGWDLWRKRKLPEAEKAFKLAVRKDPTNTSAWNGLGWSQFNQGKPMSAKVSFQKCLDLEPKHAAALNGMGWIAKGREQTDEALAYWRQAVEAAPMATAALGGLTSTYMELEQYDEAIKYYEMWLKVDANSAEAKAGLEKAKSAAAAAGGG